MKECPSSERLQKLLNSQLLPHDEKFLEPHLDVCQDCQSILEQLTSGNSESVVSVADSPSIEANDKAANESTLQNIAEQDTAMSRGDEQLDERELRQLRKHMLIGSSPQVQVDDSAGDHLPTVPGYQIVEKLGHGGMGEVYRARDESLNRLVAIKLLHTHLETKPDNLVRFRVEAETIANLKHPNIVQLYESGWHGNRPYFALELVEGGSLAEQFDGQPLLPQIAADFVRTVASAVDYSHQRGVIHRDLKPANILLPVHSFETRDFSQLKVADFGLARQVEKDVSLTQAGALLGTPSYMAPEQVHVGSGGIGVQADVYALGAILYELIAGRPPFVAATTHDTITQLVNDEPVSPRQIQRLVPRDLETICLKCLAKVPEHRYESAEALAQDLSRFRDGRPIHARPVGPLARTWKWARRRPAVAASLAGMITTLVVATIVSSLFAVQANREAINAFNAKNVAVAAQDRLEVSERESRQQSASLLLDQGIKLADEGSIAESLHWMLASLKMSPLPEFQNEVRRHLESWSRSTPKLLWWHDDLPQITVFSPDGQTVATAAEFNNDKGSTLQLWRSSTGELVAERDISEPGVVTDLTFHPSGETLLIAISHLANISEWTKAQDGTELPELKRINGLVSIRPKQWIPGTTNLIHTEFLGASLVVWDAGDEKQLFRWRFRHGRVTKVACGRDGTWAAVLVSPRQRGKAELHVVDLTNGNSLGSVPFNFGDVSSLTVDGTLIEANCKSQPPIQNVEVSFLWDAAQRTLTDIGQRKEFRSSGKPSNESTDNMFAANSSRLQIWRSADYPEVDVKATNTSDTTRRSVRAVVSQDGNRAWVASPSLQTVQAFDLTSGAPASAAIPCSRVHDRLRFATSLNGRRVATFGGKEKETLYLWDVSNGQIESSVKFKNHDVKQVVYHPNGNVLAVRAVNYALYLVDATTGEQVCDPYTIPRPDLDLVFSPDGSLLAVNEDKEIHLVDLETYSPITRRLKAKQTIRQLLFSPDSKTLLANCTNSAQLWDVTSGQRIGEMVHGSETPISATHRFVAFSPKGRLILISNGVSSFRLWDSGTCKPLGRPTPLGTQQQSCFAFSLDEQFVVVGHEDGTAQVWDAKTCRRVGGAVRQSEAVVGVTFLGDGKNFKTVSASGVVRLWRVPRPASGSLESLQAELELLTNRRMDAGNSVVELTFDERKTRESGAAKKDGRCSIYIPLSDKEWREHRVSHAEQTRDSLQARNHLDWLIRNNPDNWTWHARRATTLTDNFQWDAAETELRRVSELTSRENIIAWHWRSINHCATRNNWQSVLWYINRMVVNQPRNWRLFETRAKAKKMLSDAGGHDADMKKAAELRSSSANKSSLVPKPKTHRG